MFEIFKVLWWIMISAYLLDAIIISAVVYLFTNTLGVSIVVGIISMVGIIIKDRVIDRYI